MLNCIVNYVDGLGAYSGPSGFPAFNLFLSGF
jgi:hypothetical protein